MTVAMLELLGALKAREMDAIADAIAIKWAMLAAKGWNRQREAFEGECHILLRYMERDENSRARWAAAPDPENAAGSGAK